MPASSLLADMQKTLKQYEPVIRTWLSAAGSLDDPYETEYRENYAPANAAVVLAYLSRVDDGRSAPDLLKKTIGRSLDLLRNKEVNPFCRVFLYHYSLMALMIAPERERSRLLAEYSEEFARYVDDCAVLNTNCAALQWAMELYTEALGLRPANQELLEQRIRFISSAQFASGFINDEVDPNGAKDGMPIAYHLFTLFIIQCALELLDSWPQANLKHSRRTQTQTQAQAILDKGLSWLEHAISPDATLAMVGRSSHQMFTWGALVTLLAGQAVRERPLVADPEQRQLPFYTDSMLEKAFAYWLSYKQEDGTYSCTPNYWPHTLRVGYESYTHLNMYNLLGLTGIVVAAHILSRKHPDYADDVQKHRSISRTDSIRQHKEASLKRDSRRHDGLWIDRESGYAFYRDGERFFGCTIRMHHRKYAPAMQVFHVRMADGGLPLAEARLPGLATTAATADKDGVWEGLLAADAGGNLTYPDANINASVEALPDGMKLSTDTASYHVEKIIRLTDQGISWTYTVTAHTELSRLEQLVPLLVHNGREAMTFSGVEHTRVDCRFIDKTFRLNCDQAQSVQVGLNRSLLSPSGVSANARVRLPAPLQAGETVNWTTSFTIIGLT